LTQEETVRAAQDGDEVARLLVTMLQAEQTSMAAACSQEGAEARSAADAAAEMICNAEAARYENQRAMLAFNALDKEKQDTLLMLKSRARNEKNSSTTFHGVTKTASNQWKAAIKIGGQRHNLGLFDFPELAGAAYDERAREAGRKVSALNYHTEEEQEKFEEEKKALKEPKQKKQKHQNQKKKKKRKVRVKCVKCGCTAVCDAGGCYNCGGAEFSAMREY
jgi:hypothetical protein